MKKNGTTSTMIDYFAVLGLRSNATEAEIKKAYRVMALKYHPDKNPSPAAKEMFLKINEAYSYLMDADRRQSLVNRPKVSEKRKQEFYARKQQVYENWVKNERHKVYQQAQKAAQTPYEKFEEKLITKMAIGFGKLFSLIILFISFMVIFMPWIAYLTEEEPEKRISLFYVIVLSIFGLFFLYGAYKMNFERDE